MNELLESFNFNELGEGFHQTRLPSVRIFKTSVHQERMPFFYDQGVIFVLQGSENVYWGGQVYRYDPEQYLVLSVSLPAECETYGSSEEPVIALIIDFDMALLNQLISQIKAVSSVAPAQNHSNSGLAISTITPSLKLALRRMLLLLHDPVDVSVLGRVLLTEIHYHVLRSENFNNLISLSESRFQMNKIERALTYIHEEYGSKMDIEQLSQLVNMSATTFYRSFKQVTACSPVQYLKKVRLTQAKKLLVEESLQVKVVADRVGYESTSQFSREFKRYFGQSPGAV